MNGDSANILVEGFQVQYRNNVGDVQLKQTYSGLTGSTPAIRFSTGVTANAVVIGAGGNLTVAGSIFATGTPIQIAFKSFGDATTLTTNQSYTSCTNGTLTITSKIANSKFLVQVIGQGYASGASGINLGINRTIGSAVRLVGVDGASGETWAGSTNGSGTNSWTIVREYLDAPSQAAGTSITYTMLVGLWSGGTVYVNYAGYGITSTIRIIEIAP
jgi:hypothetical protein